MGCATLPIEESLDDAMKAASNFGQDFLSGYSEFLGAAVEGSFALIGADVDVPTIPWRDTGKEKKTNTPKKIKKASPSRKKSEPEILVDEHISRAMSAYRSFHYEQGVRSATDAIKIAKTATEIGQAHVIRGACLYLMNDLSRAKQDFAVARLSGIESMDSNVFPHDMISFFERSR